jgi:hypothetical protein
LLLFSQLQLLSLQLQLLSFCLSSRRDLLLFLLFAFVFAVVFAFVFACHSERSEEPPHFAFAVAVVFVVTVLLISQGSLHADPST